MPEKKPKVNLTLLLTLLSEKHYASQIARLMGVSRPAISHHIKRLLQQGIIIKSPESEKNVCDFYIVKKPLTTSGDTLTHKTIRTEHYQIKMPIVKDNPNFEATIEKKDGFGHWVRKYIQVDFPFDVTVEKTTKNIILHCHQKEFAADMNFFADFAMYTAKAMIYFGKYLSLKGIDVDLTKAEIISQEMETKTPEQNDKVEPNIKATIKLGRPAQSILGEMKTEAKAYLDRSHNDVEIGTNDLRYEEKLLLMPEVLEKSVKLQAQMANSLRSLDEKFTPAIETLTEQIKLHLLATTTWKETAENINITLSKISETMKSIHKNTAKPLKKLDWKVIDYIN